MKQVVMRPRTGSVEVLDVPIPALRSGWVLIATRYSVVSTGTERSKVELGEKNLLQKARARPDLVKKTLDRARADGVRAALELARGRLASPAPMGYSSAGTVLAVGSGVEGLAPGDRVACAGAGWANHAEVVAVPRNLVAPVPDDVDLADAAYATLGAIALHGFRQAEATVGEHIGVIGLGVVGHLAALIGHAAGCIVFGIDVDPAAVALAAGAGVRAYMRDRAGLEGAIRAAGSGLGLDAVLICAASVSADPLELAARLARDRGRLVVVGEVPVAVDRALLYEKELEVRISRSYGPGRYQHEYEEHGVDLPAGYVRWTEQRNLGAFLELVAAGRVVPGPLTTHRFPIERAAEAYDLLRDHGEGPRPFGILLEYPQPPPPVPPAVVPTVRVGRHAAYGPRIGLIGTGSFARSTLLPELVRQGAQLVAATSVGGLSAGDVAARFGFQRASASAEDVVAAEDIDAVVIATRHADHARLTAAALRAGKAVFVEKPLALCEEELGKVEEAQAEGGLLMVGFNRRFAPLAERLRSELEGPAGKVLLVRVNAGPLPDEHWLHDPLEGGGRLLGEVCHFVDLILHLAGARAVSAHAFAVPQPQRSLECSDALVVSLRHADGTAAALVYAGTGDPTLPKERVEAYGGGLSAVLDDFRRLDLHRGSHRTTLKGKRNKGHVAEIACFLAAARGRVQAPSFESYIHSTRTTLALVRSLQTGGSVEIG